MAWHVKKTQVVFVTYLLIVLLIISGCSDKSIKTEPLENTTQQVDVQTEKAVEKSVKLQEEAVRLRDENAYMATVFKENEIYWNESRYLANKLKNANFSDFKMDVMGIRREAEDQVVVTIRQSYLQNGTLNQTTYQERYRLVEGQWLDNDVAFDIMNEGVMIIRYMSKVSNVSGMIDMIKKSAENVESTFPESLSGTLEFKLYSDRELLRQKTDLGVEWLFTGWSEIGHAIKAFTERDESYSYEVLFTHELIHKLTLFEANGNMPIWFAEGLATYYGNFKVYDATYIEQGTLDYKDVKMTLEQLKSLNLETMTNLEDITAYYGTAGMIVNYLSETYGDPSVFEIYQTLGTYAFNDIASNPDWWQVSDQHFDETISKVLNKDIDQISSGYLKWIKAKEAAQ